jgi:hypothetical protein
MLNSSAPVGSEKDTKILVTGAAGFICGYLIEELLQALSEILDEVLPWIAGQIEVGQI